jgi:hypothetical protein
MLGFGNSPTKKCPGKLHRNAEMWSVVRLWSGVVRGRTSVSYQNFEINDQNQALWMS